MSAHLPATIRDGRHHYFLRIYFEDTDAAGIVYHANYLRFAERARSEALRDLDAPHAELVGQHARLFVVRRVKLDYLRPARLDDGIMVTTEVVALGGASVMLRQGFARVADAQDFPGVGDAVLAIAEIALGCVRLADQRPVRLPERWRAALARLAGDDRSGKGDA